MPFISVKTNVAVCAEKQDAIKSRLGQAMGMIGKSESWLMLSFEECTMYFKGEKDAPMAFCNVMLHGAASDDAYQKLTAEVTRIFSEELGIAPSQFYIKYEEVAHWGWNGSNF